jgi:hypothetical protein
MRISVVSAFRRKIGAWFREFRLKAETTGNYAYIPRILVTVATRLMATT